MPGMKSFSFVYNSIPLDYRAAQTRRALSKLKANYHLFLRNQPRKPGSVAGRLRGRTMGWKAPVVKY